VRGPAGRRAGPTTAITGGHMAKAAHQGGALRSTRPATTRAREWSPDDVDAPAYDHDWRDGGGGRRAMSNSDPLAELPREHADGHGRLRGCSRAPGRGHPGRPVTGCPPDAPARHIRQAGEVHCTGLDT